MVSPAKTGQNKNRTQDRKGEDIESVTSVNSQIYNGRIIQHPIKHKMEEEHVDKRETDKRRGTRFCGCCCDYRRATVIVNLVQLTVLLIYLASVLGYDMVAETYPHDNNDEWHTNHQEWEDSFNDYRITVSILLAVCIVTTCLAILGTILYSIFLVGFGTVSFLIFYVVDMILLLDLCQDWNDDDYFSQCESSPLGFAFSIFLALFFVYPNAGFIIQVWKGIMSPNTFKREKAACC